jgi:hypothetical protein
MSDKAENLYQIPKAGVILIHGKEYHTVAKRVGDFRDTYNLNTGWGVKTEILEHTQEHATVRAIVSDPAGRIIATGHATEHKALMDGWMQGSMLEVAETSAVGRALAFAGYAGTEIASADEMQRKQPEPSMSRVRAYAIMRTFVAYADASENQSLLKAWNELTHDQKVWIVNKLDKVNNEKIIKCLKAADEEILDEDIFLQALDKKPAEILSEKDQRRVDVRKAKEDA